MRIGIAKAGFRERFGAQFGSKVNDIPCSLFALPPVQKQVGGLLGYLGSNLSGYLTTIFTEA